MATEGRWWRWWLAAGLPACVAYLLLPRGLVAQVLFVGIACSAVVAGLLRDRSDRQPTRTAWLIVTAGFGLGALGELLELISLRLELGPTAGSVIDLVFLTGYVVQLCGLMSLFRARTASRHRFGWFDAAAIAVAVGTVVWTSMYAAIFGRSRATPLDWVTRFGGAILGVALVVTALRLVVSTRGRQRECALLLAAFLVQLVTDAVAAMMPSYTPGARVDALWAAAYVLMGAAIVDVGTAGNRRVAPTREARMEIRHTLVLQGAVTLLLAAMVIFEVHATVPLATLIVWAIAWMLILVVTRVRVFGLLRMVGEASATEHQRRLTAMVAGSQDVIGLADPDGAFRYLTPSIGRQTGVPVEEWIGHRFDVLLVRHLGGLDDLAVRCASLDAGEQATWECTGAVRDDGVVSTIKLTVANQIDVPEVGGWVITAHDVTDEARLTSELRHQSLHDTLTGLPNRALLFDRIQHSLDRMRRRTAAHVAVLLVDIDDFKAVNDSLGHTTGDELLRAVAERLATSVRQGDTVARLGGDEFAMLLEDTDEDEAIALAHRALECLALPVHIGSGDFAVSASIGVVVQSFAADPVELLRAADIAMYASKRDGKSRVTLFRDDMHEAARDQLELRMDMATALDRGEFALVYQPIVDTASQRITGVEALIRWHHPSRGVVSPLDFIPIAEQTGLIRVIGAWVLRTACAEAASWTGDGAHAYISVNVAAPQLADSEFPDLVIDVLADTGLAPHRLLVEITESMLVDDASDASSGLSRLRDLGVRVAIDDFGTGYSSLSYLRSMSVDVVKIDQSFVRDLATSSDRQALTRSILTLAEGLGMSAIAEGVETDQDLAALAAMSCPFAQGFLFSRPVPAGALRVLFGASAAAA